MIYKNYDVLSLQQKVNEIDEEITNGLNQIETELADKLATKANKSELTTINNTLNSKVDKVYVDTQMASIKSNINTTNTTIENMESEINSSLELLNNTVNTLRYGSDTKLLNGFDVTVRNNTYNVGAGTCVLNNINYSIGAGTYSKPVSVLQVSGKLTKDPYVIKEGNTYYMFYTFKTVGVTAYDIGYATSTDGVNWIHKGTAVSHTNGWKDSTTNDLWAPCVIKDNNKYYMFICCGVGGLKMGFFKSTSLTSGWTWVSTLKNSSGNVIVGIDAEIYEENGTYYLFCSGSGDNQIDVYSSTNPINNSWVLKKSGILKIDRIWEGHVMEAVSIIKKNGLYYMFYGANDSESTQRVGLAVSDSILGEYKKVGSEGMLALDYTGTRTGAISHPCIYQIGDTYYLYCCVCESGINYNISAYTSKDLFKWKVAKSQVKVTAGVTNYLYINPLGEKIIATDLPFKVDYIKNSRDSVLRIGELTVNSSGQVTSFTKFRKYKVISTINCNMSYSATQTSTGFTALWSYLGGNLPIEMVNPNEGKLVYKFTLSCPPNTQFNARVNFDNGTYSKVVNAIPKYVNQWHDHVSNWTAVTPTNATSNPIVLEVQKTTMDFTLGTSSSITIAYEY